MGKDKLKHHSEFMVKPTVPSHHKKSYTSSLKGKGRKEGRGGELEAQEKEAEHVDD